jgi:four helix bundle protein
MAIQHFEELIAWQKSQDIAMEVYKAFEGVNDTCFKEQICRAAVSISSFIAEGFETNSNIEFGQYLKHALTAVSEVKSMLYIASRMQIIQESSKAILLQNADEIAAMLHGLIKSMPTN